MKKCIITIFTIALLFIGIIFCLRVGSNTDKKYFLCPRSLQMDITVLDIPLSDLGNDHVEIYKRPATTRYGIRFIQKGE